MFVVAVLALAALCLIITRLRASWALISASVVAAAGTVIWGLLMLYAAIPCGLSGRGVLRATPQCPVQTTHYVSAVIGVGSLLALGVGIVGAVAYTRDREPRTRRKFQFALLAAAGLVALWLASDLILPRAHPSD